MATSYQTQLSLYDLHDIEKIVLSNTTRSLSGKTMSPVFTKIEKAINTQFVLFDTAQKTLSISRSCLEMRNY